MCGAKTLLGANLASMSAGTDSLKPCYKFSHTVGAFDDSVVLLTNKKERECFFCTGVNASAS
jgi:hypothetical protein